MKILVTGGTGFTGKALVKQLLNDRHDVIALDYKEGLKTQELSIGIRPIGVLSQSFDHRAIDGAYSAAFLDRLRSLLEQHDWSAEF